MRKVVLFLFFVASGLLLTGCASKKPTSSPPVSVSAVKPTPVPTKPIEQSIVERPYVFLNMSSDGHWVTINVKNIPEGITGIDYELLYMADVEGSKVERGISTGGKPVDLKGAKEYSKKELLGSASCTTGVCKYRYDEGVAEGTLTIKLVGKDAPVQYQTVFRLQKGPEAVEGFTTGDGVFTYTASGLPTKSLYLTISTIGVPAQLPEGITAKTVPYSVFPSAGMVKAGTVSFKSSLDAVSIYAYDGRTWKKLTTTTAGGLIKASTFGESLFILAE